MEDGGWNMAGDHGARTLRRDLVLSSIFHPPSSSFAVYFAVSLTRRLRKATGPWSPWSMTGPVGASLGEISLPVGLGASTSLWISLPFSFTLTNLAFEV